MARKVAFLKWKPLWDSDLKLWHNGDLLSCCLPPGPRAVYKGKVKELIRERNILKLFSAVLAYASLRNICDDFGHDFSSNIFDYPLSRLQAIYFVFSDPPISFFQYCSFSPPHPLQKNNGPFLTIFFRHVQLLGWIICKNIFCERKIAFFKILLFCYSNSLTSWHFSYFQRRENLGHKDRARGKVKYANITFRNQFLEFLNNFSVTDSFGL